MAPLINRIFRAGLLAGLVILFSGTASGAFGADGIWAPQQLAALINEALANNLAIRSTAAQAERLQSRIPAAAALPDPKVGIAVQSLPTNSFAFDREPMTQKQIFVEQSVPWLPRLGLQSEIAARAAGEKKSELAEARLNLARDVAEAWYELGYIAESQEINAALMDLIRRIRRDAESEYAVGGGMQQDIFQADVELASLEDEAIQLANRRRAIENRLHELTGRERYQPIDPPTDLPEPVFTFSPEKLTPAAMAENPRLKGLEMAADRAETETRLAKKDYYPDFNIRLSYGQRDEDRTGRDLPDFFSAAVAMDIPLWHKSKQSKQLSAALQHQRSRENRLRDLRRRLPYQISTLVSEIDAARRRHRLYQDELIPQADQWARSALEAYQVGRVPFDTMIDARIRLLKYRREASRLLFTAYQKRAALEALSGGAPEAGKTKTSHEFKGQSHDK